MGPLVGGYLGGELWVTKNLIMAMELGRNIGSYERSGKGGLDALSVIQDIFKLKAGYRYLAFWAFFWATN